MLEMMMIQTTTMLVTFKQAKKNMMSSFFCANIDVSGIVITKNGIDLSNVKDRSRDGDIINIYNRWMERIR